MASVDIVITYTPAVGVNVDDAGEVITDLTVDGTAWASLQVNDVNKAIRTMTLAVQKLIAQKSGVLDVNDKDPLSGKALALSHTGIVKQTT